MPDLRSFTIWDIIQNTIEDPDLTLYLVLDEAHRGMKEGGRPTADGKPTIVKQLINGSGSAPGIPVVWGITMFIAMNRFRVAKGSETAFEHVWMSRDSHLEKVPGFVEFHLLKGLEAEDHALYASHTVWEN